MSEFFKSIEEFKSKLFSFSVKWKNIWEEMKVNESDPDPAKPKFFVTAAFPYTNGPLHLGHALTYTIPDIIIRYKKMKGFNVLFPMGFHYTGTPILSISESIMKGDQKTISRLVEDGVPINVIATFSEPLILANYFRDRAINSLKSLLLMIDWRRSFTSVDEEFKKFIEWQFQKLREKGYIVQGTHPVGWCPFHNSPVSMHDTLNDVEPEIQEFTLIFFIGQDGIFYPVATLRPETIYGVTNLWVNPDGRYVLIDIEGQMAVVSEKAAFKLSFQRKEVKILKTIDVRSILNTEVYNPLTGEKVKIFPAKFVDVDMGTGLVMSVPAHAPFDYTALIELGLKDKIKPISIIEIGGNPSYLGVEFVDKSNITNATEDREKLEEITKIVYLKEFSDGRMSRELSQRVIAGDDLRRIASEIEGKPVSDARDILKKLITDIGFGGLFYEIINKPVFCRCGTEVVVKIVENQWFINYDDSDWKNEALQALLSMQIIPEEYRDQFIHTIGWLKKKACARSRGLGTPLPWDTSWIIESLSDSTIYMAFYTIIHKLRKYGISSDKLTSDFWDFILLGKAELSEVSRKIGIDPEILSDIKNEFDYWYPLDNRHSGKDLIQNHLTFMIFNHVAIFSKDKWPRRIVINGHILVEGLKMSKSLGNFITIDKALSEVPPDALRLSMLLGAEIGNDVNYTRQLTSSVIESLRKIYELVYKISQSQYVEDLSEELRFLESLLESKLSEIMIEVNNSLESYRLRNAAVKIFYEVPNLIELHMKALGYYKSELIERIIVNWIKLMAPFTPSFAEELWNIIGGRGLVVLQNWPEEKTFAKDPIFTLYSKYLEIIIQDIENLRNLFRERKSVVIIPAASKKFDDKMLQYIDEPNGQKEIIKIMAKEGVPNPHDYVKRLANFIKQLDEDERGFISILCEKENEILRLSRQLLRASLNLEIVVLDENSAEARHYLSIKRQSPIFLKPVVVLI